STDHDRDRQKQKNGSHRQLVVIQILEVVVHKMLQHIDLRIGMLPSDEENLTEALERIDQRKQQGKIHGMPHLRSGDIEKLAKPSRAIQAGSRVLVFRYGHQPGK